MVELRKEWKRAQLDLERSLGMRRRGSRWRKMRPLLLVVGVLSAATLVWSWSSRLRPQPPGAVCYMGQLRGGAPDPTRRSILLFARGHRLERSVQSGHIDGFSVDVPGGTRKAPRADRFLQLL